MLTLPKHARGPIIDLELPPSLTVELVKTGGGGALATDGTYLYFNSSAETIGRVKIDGTELLPEFIKGGNSISGIAVNATHIFWSNREGNTIGRATIAGGGVNQEFIKGCTRPSGVVLNATHIFWANSTVGAGSIGRATIAGAEVNQNLITGAATLKEPDEMAIDGTYLYWGNTGNVTGQTTKTICRAKLAGTEPTVLITGLATIVGLAVDATYIYYGQAVEGRQLSRAKLDGSSKVEPLVSGIKSAEGIAVSKGRIYFGNYFNVPASISRANIIKTVIKNNTTGKQMTINLPASWDGTDLTIDFYRRSLTDANGVDRSAFVDASDHELWLAAEPLITGNNDFEIEFKSESGGGANAFAYVAKAILHLEQGHF
ncbi:MAG TPA: DUF5050 domain-containing protein [Solirubrobacterales bacterium]